MIVVCQSCFRRFNSPFFAVASWPTCFFCGSLRLERASEQTKEAEPTADAAAGPAAERVGLDRYAPERRKHIVETSDALIVSALGDGDA